MKNTCPLSQVLKLLLLIKTFQIQPPALLFHNVLDMFKKKVALCDIAKIEKSQIFVLFENETSYQTS